MHYKYGTIVYNTTKQNTSYTYVMSISRMMARHMQHHNDMHVITVCRMRETTYAKKIKTNCFQQEKMVCIAKNMLLLLSAGCVPLAYASGLRGLQENALYPGKYEPWDKSDRKIFSYQRERFGKMGFCVAKTKNGSSNLYVLPPAVTWCSCIASRSAAWVLGGVRLISSAKIILAKTGPFTNCNVRRPVVRSSSITSVPIISEGIKSGVN